jgi:hypothetical protein
MDIVMSLTVCQLMLCQITHYIQQGVPHTGGGCNT